MKKFIVFALFVICCHVMASDTMVDSGINYKEAVLTINNPGAGYLHYALYDPSQTYPTFGNTSGHFVMMWIRIRAYSSALNSKGEDYPFDDNMLNSLRQNLFYARAHGSMVAMRFRYTDEQVSNPEPATWEMVLRHIQQLRPIFQEFNDIICLIESSFVGMWGEQHSGKYCSARHRAQLIDALMNVAPENIAVTARIPGTFAAWAGVSTSDLYNEKAYEKARNSPDPLKRRLLCRRVGVFNDGYMGSWSDLGTYFNRKGETDWIGNVTPETYYGGEFAGYHGDNTYLPETAIPEMYKTHLSYIGNNIFQDYKQFTFTREMDTVAADNSAYYGQTTFQFIRDHIGYRFVLRKSELTNKVKQGETLKLKFRVENTGFSAPVPHTRGFVLLVNEDDEIYIKAPVNNSDAHYWNSCTVVDVEHSLHIPSSIKPGTWKVYYKNVMGGYHHEIEEIAYRSIRFANYDTWKSEVGGNYLGSVEISETENRGTNNGFYEIIDDGKGPASTEYLYYQVTPIIDGQISYAHEWPEDSLVAEMDGNKLYVRADEKNIYVLGILPQATSQPVYNVFVTLARNRTVRFWQYWGDGTYHHISPYTRLAGINCKWGPSMVEYVLPYTWFDMKAEEVEFASLGLSKQDSSVSGWGSFGSVYRQNFTIPVRFSSYNVAKDLVIARREDFELTAECFVDGITFQWYKDDVPIEGATSRTYVIKSAGSSDKGVYSVKMFLPDGSPSLIVIANITDVKKATSSSNIITVNNLFIGLLFIIMMITI